MNDGQDLKNKGIFRGRAKTWAQVISWLHTILNGLALILAITACVLFFGFEFWNPELDEIAKYGATHYSVVRGSHLAEPDPAETKRSYLRAIAIWFGLCMAEYLTGFVAGVILIIGVQQGDKTKITIWMITTAVLLILTSLVVIYTVMATGWNETLPRMIILFINYFCIWPVNTYRKELLQPSLDSEYNKSSRKY